MKTASGTEHADMQAFEFTDSQNEVIRSAGFWIGVWGAFTLIGGALNGAAGVALLFVGNLAGILGGVILGLVSLIPILIGLEFSRTGAALRAVVSTAGSDIDHLMDALAAVRSAFRIQIVAVVSWFAMLVVIMAVFVETRVR